MVCLKGERYEQLRVVLFEQSQSELTGCCVTDYLIGY